MSIEPVSVATAASAQAEIHRLEDALLRFAPFREWQIVTVTFPATPNTDLDIAHLLDPSDPEKVIVQVLAVGMPCLVYTDRSATRTAWSTGVIRLRATAASVQVVLLLATPHQDLPTTLPVVNNLSLEADRFYHPGGVSFGYFTSTGIDNSALGPGVQIGDATTFSAWPRWRILADAASTDTSTNKLTFVDVEAGLRIGGWGFDDEYYWAPRNGAVTPVDLGNPIASSNAGRWNRLYLRNEIYERARTVALGEWATYAIAWTAASSNPALGNGTLTGRYTRVGETIHYRINLSMGSTTTFGTGDWRFSLPVAAAFEAPVYGYARDATAGTRHFLSAGEVTSTTIALFVDGSSTNFSSTVPFTWAQDDTLILVGSYET